MASGVAGEFLQFLLQGQNQTNAKNFEWAATAGDTCRLALVLSAYTFDPDTHEFMSSVGTNRANASAADVADEDIVGITDPSVVTASNAVRCDASTTLYTFAGIDTSQTVLGCVLYWYDGTNNTDALRRIISNNEFSGGTIAADGSDIEVNLHADGLFELTY